MTHERIEPTADIASNDRLFLANTALGIVHEYERNAEVQIYLKELLEGSGNEALQAIDALSVPFETYKDIGRLLQGRLRDEFDQRTVKVRTEERLYRVVYDPDVTRQRQMRNAGRSSIRGMGYLGNSNRSL